VKSKRWGTRVRGVFSCGVGACLLVACVATRPFDAPDVAERVSHDLGLNQASVRRFEHCVHGQAFSGAQTVALSECVYLETGSEGLLVGYDKTRGQFQTVATLDASTSGVALKTHHSLLGDSAEIQIKNDRGYLIFDLPHSGANTTEHIATLTRTVDYLRGLGIPEIPGRDFVPATSGRGTVAIPIFVPARR